MKRITIQDFGPIMTADIWLKSVNVIIGEQSIGKSCVLKVACFCTWVEKRIMIEQNASRFETNGGFISELTKFHRLGGFVHNKTFIGYESKYMKFSYDEERGFKYEWKPDRWEYKRPKVSYIPAERNMVAVIPNWFEVKSVSDNIQDFMADWSEARKGIDNDKEILNLNVAYHYEESSDTDYVKTQDGHILPFANVSSGLQSLIPMYVHLLHINSTKFREKEDNSVKHKSEQENLISALVNYYDKNIGQAFVKNPDYGKAEKGVGLEKEYVANPDMTRWLFGIYQNITQIDHCEVFLEEPEQNLFPPTQQILMRALMRLVEREGGNTLFVSTHSPYILDVLLEREKYDYGLFFAYASEGGSLVKSATEEDVQDMFEGGVDAFFNIERFGDEA